MKAEILFKGSPVTSFRTLLEQYAVTEFASPARSTVPSIAFWSSPDNRIPDLANLLNLVRPIECRMEFEHLTTPPKGTGKESHTDIMISWDDVCIGVEAKYTEGPYDTVSAWKTKGTSQANREAVLDGWCNLIRARTNTEFPIEAVSDITYQMIHRLAAVCSAPQRRAHVIYQVFNPDDKKRTYYLSQLLKLKEAIGESDVVKLWVYYVDIVPSDNYRHLLRQWESHRRN